MRLFPAVPFILMGFALVALSLAIWFAVRRPPTAPAPRRRKAWQALQAVLSAASASVAALCVLLTVSAMS